jgi:phage-related protein
VGPSGGLLAPKPTTSPLSEVVIDCPYKLLYNPGVSEPHFAEKQPPKLKPLAFRGNSLNELKEFPEHARHEAGYQLEKVQGEREPTDWKPMTSIGPGVCEIRIHDEDGAFRVIYVAKFSAAVYVLHCFQKKTQKTSKTDLAVAIKRYKELVEESKL